MKNIVIKKKVLVASLLSVILLTCELAKLDTSNDTLNCEIRNTNEKIESQVNLDLATTITEHDKSWKDYTHHVSKVCQTSWFRYLVRILWSLLQNTRQQAKGRKQKKRN